MHSGRHWGLTGTWGNRAGMRAVDELERAEKLDALVAAQLADPLGNPHRVSAFLLGVLGELARHLSPVDPVTEIA